MNYFALFGLKTVKIGSSTEFKKLSNLLLFHEEVIHFYKHLFSEVVTPSFGDGESQPQAPFPTNLRLRILIQSFKCKQSCFDYTYIVLLCLDEFCPLHLENVKKCVN